MVNGSVAAMKRGIEKIKTVSYIFLISQFRSKMLSLFLLNRIIHTNIKEIYRGQRNCRNSADETVYRDESQASRCDIAFQGGGLL